MVKVEISDMLASCLQRMLVEEIENQEKWQSEEDEEFGYNKRTHETRDRIIQECEDLRTQLESQGIHKYYKY